MRKEGSVMTSYDRDGYAQAYPFEPGDKVVGLGRHGNPWPQPGPVGTVTEVWWLDGDPVIRVRWDGSVVEDDMEPGELRRSARRRRTKCEIVADHEQAVAAWPDDMPAEAARFETEGWALGVELAPRCDDPDCEICHG